MVALGYGKFVRADRVFALVPLDSEERGDGRRTYVHVEGLAEPLVASRSERAIMADLESAVAEAAGVPAKARAPRRARPACLLSRAGASCWWPGFAVALLALLALYGALCSGTGAAGREFFSESHARCVGESLGSGGRGASSSGSPTAPRCSPRARFK